MGFIEEGRQLIQDFVTPEIRSLDARLTALEKAVDALDAKADKRFDAVDKRFENVDKRFEGIDIRFDSVDKRLETIDGKIDRNFDRVIDTLHKMENYNMVIERLARLESKILNVA